MSGHRWSGRAVLGGLLLAGGAILSAAQGGTFQTTAPARDSTRQPVLSGHSSISGVVMSDQSSPSPIPRVTITISTTDGEPVSTVYTDARGQFTVSNLAAGRYLLVATKAAYVRAPYGARRYDRQGTPITVADGQQVSNISIRMARGAVISGTVTDDGQPVPNAMVRLSQYRTVNGERTLLPLLSTGGPTSDMTDDRGGYRIFGLPAGEYVVSVTPRLLGGGEIRQMTPADIQSVRQAIQAAAANAGQGAAAQHGPDPVTVTYANVYYPGTTVATNAGVVAVNAGEERGGIDMATQLVRTAHIDGTVVTPAGVPPQSVQLLLLSNAGTTGAAPLMVALNRVSVGPDGKFSYTGIAPGDYTITARAMAQGGNGANANVAPPRGTTAPAGLPPIGPGGGLQLWGQTDVSVGGDNIAGITITMQPGMTVSGRVSAEAIGVEAPDLTRARISLLPAGSGNMVVVNGGVATVDASGRFTMTGVVPGKYRLSASLSSPEANWSAKSAIAKGRDLLDVPLDIAPNEELSNVAVTFTNASQEVSGRLSDGSGRPATDYTIVIFPADKNAWSSSRRTRTARPGTDGRFVLPNLPAGEYRMAAATDVAPGDTSDPSFLAEIAAASIPVSLKDGEKKVQDIKLAGGGL